jgi:hypothetical protein
MKDRKKAKRMKGKRFFHHLHLEASTKTYKKAINSHTFFEWSEQESDREERRKINSVVSTVNKCTTLMNRLRLS